MSINPSMLKLGQVRSAIRETFEYGNRRAAEIGRDNVFDFSLGNPSIPPPEVVSETMLNLLRNESPVSLHGYTSAAGDYAVREAISRYLASNFQASISPDGIYMTCGAAASLTISLHALTEDGDEWIVFAPYFPEYRVFVENAGAKLVVVPPEVEHFYIDFDAFKKALTPRTKGVIVNTPNNPTGVVLPRSVIETLCGILKEASAMFGHTIYLLTDEPYRELVYDASTEVPYIPSYYDATLVCYSFSKSLSLPGDRIGYIAVPNTMPQKADVFAAICGAGRALGYVCAPSFMQKIIPSCLGHVSDLETYRTNRDLLYDALTSYGFECVYPDGAFYLFLKSPTPDAKAFCEKAKEYELLLGPSDRFGFAGYVRIAYCVDTAMIMRALPAFKQLALSYFH